MTLHIPKFIKPTWAIEDYHQLNYNRAHYRDQSLNETFIAAGHQRDSMQVFNYFEPSPMPTSVQYICGEFQGLKNIAVAVNLFVPGTYLPIHKDLYGKYQDLYGGTVDKIFRAIVMLEDSSPGQIIQIENQCWGNWSAGEVFHWFGDTDHAFYNMSLKNRYALQITGTVDE